MDKTPKQVSIKDVAEMSGYAVSTVSRALADSTGVSVSSKAKTKILKVAEKLGYRKNPAVSNMMSSLRKSSASTFNGTIAYIKFNPRDGIDYPCVDSVLDGVRVVGEEYGMQVEEYYEFGYLGSPDRLCRILKARGINQILFIGFDAIGSKPEVYEYFQHFVVEGFILVHVGATVKNYNGIHNVFPNESYCIRIAMKELINADFGRIGLVLPFRKRDSDTVWTFLQEQKSLKKLNRLPPFFYRAHSPYSQNSFANWVKMHKPDVVVLIDSRVFEWLYKLKVTVPEDLSVVHMALDKKLVGCAGIDPQWDKIGRESVHLLMEMHHRSCRNIDHVERSVQVPGLWVDGTTVVAQGQAQSKRSGTRSYTRSALVPLVRKLNSEPL